jgi:hypothetical protein
VQQTSHEDSNQQECLLPLPMTLWIQEEQPIDISWQHEGQLLDQPKDDMHNSMEMIATTSSNTWRIFLLGNNPTI